MTKKEKSGSMKTQTKPFLSQSAKEEKILKFTFVDRGIHFVIKKIMGLRLMRSFFRNTQNLPILVVRQGTAKNENIASDKLFLEREKRIATYQNPCSEEQVCPYEISQRLREIGCPDVSTIPEMLNVLNCFPMYTFSLHTHENGEYEFAQYSIPNKTVMLSVFHRNIVIVIAEMLLHVFGERVKILRIVNGN